MHGRRGFLDMQAAKENTELQRHEKTLGLQTSGGDLWGVGNFPEDLKTQLTSEIINLYNLFINVDATQVEINPMGITDDNKVVCFDAKINFDDCAEF